MYGEPDVIQIRKTFTDAKSCLLWEEKFLKRVNAVHSDIWLNKNINGSFFCSSDETSKKISEALKGNVPWNKGKKLGPQPKEVVELRTKMSGRARKGVKLSEKHKQALSSSHIGNIPWNKDKTNVQVPWNKGKTGIYSEEVKKTMGAKNIGKTPWNKRDH